MLAFDYTPASFFNPDGLIRSQMFAPELFLQCQRQQQSPLHHYHQHQHQPRRIVRSRSYQPRRLPQEESLHSFLNQLIQHAEKQEPKSTKPEVNAKVFNTRDTYQIQVHKNDANFNHYSIRYKVTGPDALIIIESEVDDFAKGFRFSQNKIEVDNVQWRVVRNVLVIDVPKSKEEFILRPAVSFAKRVEKTPSAAPEQQSQVTPTPEQVSTSKPDQKSVEKHVEESPSPKPSSTAAQQSTPKARIISIPIEFVDSESEVTPKSSRSSSITPSITESLKSNMARTESEAELSDDESGPSTKLPKLKRKVSIEEVEDESLHMSELD